MFVTTTTATATVAAVSAVSGLSGLSGAGPHPFGTAALGDAAPPTPPTPPTTPTQGQYNCGPPARLALFVITPGAFLELMTGGRFRIKSTLPADSTMYGAPHYDAREDLIAVVIRSEEFEPVRPGEPIPQILSPLVTREPQAGPEKHAPARAATGWALTVAYDPIGCTSTEVMARLNALPAVVRERYTFESRRDAVWAEVLLSDLPVSTHVAPDCGGAQPLA